MFTPNAANGLAHLNLHQLHTTRYCHKQFINRGYTFLHQPDLPVLESEMTALQIVKYNLENNIGLAINYCSAIYKNRFQRKGYRERFQSCIKEEYEGFTEFGFIRRLTIQDTPVNLKQLVTIFQKNKCHDSLWFFREIGSELLVHHSLLKHIDFNQYSLILNYFTPQLKDVCDKQDEAVQITLNPNRNIFVEKVLAYQTKINNAAAINCFQELFIEKMKISDVFKKFYQDYDLKTQANIDDMMNAKDQLDYLKTWEFIGQGLYEIY